MSALEKALQQWGNMKDGQNHSNKEADPVAALLRQVYDEAFLEGQGRTTLDVIELSLGICYSKKGQGFKINNQPKVMTSLSIDSLTILPDKISFFKRVKLAFGLFKKLKNF